MTRQEVDAALVRLGLDVPEAERSEIADATRLLDDIRVRLRPAGRGVFAEPAHTVAFPKKRG